MAESWIRGPCSAVTTFIPAERCQLPPRLAHVIFFKSGRQEIAGSKSNKNKINLRLIDYELLLVMPN